MAENLEEKIEWKLNWAHYYWDKVNEETVTNPKDQTSDLSVNFRYRILSGGIQRTGSKVWSPTCDVVDEFFYIGAAYVKRF